MSYIGSLGFETISEGRLAIFPKISSYGGLHVSECGVILKQNV